ncbi:hypothetical protein SOVF_216740 [Spinacia oleracea]|nr:hypothetical protein SOVF_216740 [Spinacia oleracea]
MFGISSFFQSGLFATVFNHSFCVATFMVAVNLSCSSWDGCGLWDGTTRTHPGFGCWLSGVDISTQQLMEYIGQVLINGLEVKHIVMNCISQFFFITLEYIF